MVYLTKRVRFSASHRLHNPELGDEENRRIYGPCNNPNGHGHNYLLEVTVAGQPDPRTGMILNLDDLAKVMDERIVNDVDHKHLNHDVAWLAGVIPTVENLTKVFWRALADAIPAGSLVSVKLQETENSWATYRGE